jgi:hypothetical protein
MASSCGFQANLTLIQVLFDNGSLGHEGGRTNQSRQSEFSGSDGITFTGIHESNNTSTKYIGPPRTTPSSFATQGIFTVWVRQRIYGYSAEVIQLTGVRVYVADS